MDQLEAEEKKQQVNRQGRSLGLPEMDPDALPSSLVEKYLRLDCSWLNRSTQEPISFNPILDIKSSVDSLPQDCFGKAYEEDAGLS